MKKRIVLFSTSIILASGLFMSYEGGPADVGILNRTGVNNGQNNCSTGGCHSGGTFTNNNLGVILVGPNGPTSTFEPGVEYTLMVDGTTDAPQYGFQLVSAWHNGTTSVQAGNFISTVGFTDVITLNGFQIFEHTQALPVVVNDINAVAQWVAPDSTVDTVDFYLTVNAVNSSNSTAGDNSTNVKKSFSRHSLSVGTLSADIKIAAYPNPVTDKLNISLENAGSGIYTIRVFDVSGKIVANQSANVTKSYNTTINTTTWANGMYHIQLQKDGAQRTIAVMKH